MAGDPRFLALLDEMRAVHLRKSADYGTGEDPFANVRASAAFGVAPWVGTMIRAHDKMIRVQAMATNGRLENESVEDSLLDLAAYALIALVLYREGKDAAGPPPDPIDAILKRPHALPPQPPEAPA